MKILFLSLTFFLINPICFGSVKKQEPFSIKLNQEKFLSDKIGFLNLPQIFSLEVADLIHVILNDGSVYKGIVKTKEINEKEKIIIIFGDSVSNKDSSFGFIFKNEIFVGAVIFRNEEKTYSVKKIGEGCMLVLEPSKLTQK